MSIFYSKLYNLMCSLVQSATNSNWENVQLLDEQRRTLLESMPRPKDQSLLTPYEVALKMSILKLDSQLTELSRTALQQSKDDLARLNKQKSNCSQYIQTQGC